MARRFRYAGPRTRPSPFADTLDNALLSGPVRSLTPDERAAYQDALLARDRPTRLPEPPAEPTAEPAPRLPAHPGT